MSTDVHYKIAKQGVVTISAEDWDAQTREDNDFVRFAKIYISEEISEFDENVIEITHMEGNP